MTIYCFTGIVWSCPSMPTVLNGALDSNLTSYTYNGTNSSLHGVTVSYTCDTGYILQNNTLQQSTYCNQTTNTWDPPTLKDCTGKTCE